MKKIKLLFIMLLIVMLSGCSVFQLEFGMNVNLLKVAFNENYESRLKLLEEEEVNKKIERFNMNFSCF